MQPATDRMTGALLASRQMVSGSISRSPTKRGAGLPVPENAHPFANLSERAHAAPILPRQPLALNGHSGVCWNQSIPMGRTHSAMDPAPLPLLQRARGAGTIATVQRGDRTTLHTLYQDGCCKIRLPNTHGDSLEAVLINTAGGITGGDHLQWSATVAAGGRLSVTTQACERSYRSLGDDAQVQTRLNVGADAHLDWLPQETILFATSRLNRQLDFDLAEGASVTAVEAVLLGRDAMGEDAADARLHDSWRIRRNGRLLHAEATALSGIGTERSALSLLAGNRAFATIVHVGSTETATAAKARRIAAVLSGTGAIGMSQLGERLCIRAMAASGLALRRLIVPVLSELTGPGGLPRLWHL